MQAAQSHSDQVGTLCHQIQSATNIQLASEHNGEVHNTNGPNYIPQNLEQSVPVMLSQQSTSGVSTAFATDDPRKSAAAEVAAKLTASTSSAQMLSYVLSSLASEGVIVNPVQTQSSECPPDKKPKLEMREQAYIPQPTLPLQKPFIHPALTSAPQDVAQLQPPFQMPEFIQNVGSVGMSGYSYGPPPPGYSTIGASVTGITTPFSGSQDTNVYHALQTSEGNFYPQTSSLSLPPMAPQPQ